MTLKGLPVWASKDPVIEPSLLTAFHKPPIKDEKLLDLLIHKLIHIALLNITSLKIRFS